MSAIPITSTPPPNGGGIVRFQTNIPISLALKFADGLPVQGQYGDQFLFTLADGRKMYVPPIVAKQIAELGIRPRQPFVICKQEAKGAGGRKGIEWVVEPGLSKEAAGTVAASVAALPVTPIPPASTDEPVSTFQQQLKDSLAKLNISTEAVPSPTGSNLLRVALIAAIDAVIDAEAHASSKSHKVEFSSEDIRTMGISYFIHMAGGR